MFDTLRRLHSLSWETYLGIDTRGMVASVVTGGVHYGPLPYVVIFRMLERLHLSPDDVLVDIGSGKGRVLCLACRRRLRRVVGIEINSELVDIAEQNVRRVRQKQTDVELVQSLAQDYAYHDASAIVMYNPFDQNTMEQVFTNLSLSYQRRQRPIRVAYANCVHEEPLKRLGWLKRVEEWAPRSVGGFPHRISFWEST